MQFSEKKMITTMVFLFLVATHNGGVHGGVLESSAQKLLQKLNSKSLDAVLFWNLVVLQACSNDYDPAFTRRLDQPGPAFVSRAFAIIHGAMYQAADYFCNITTSTDFGGDREDSNSCSQAGLATVAIAQAAYRTLYELYPQQETMFDLVQEAYLEKVREDATIAQDDVKRAIRVGQKMASKQLDERKNDGSDLPSTYAPLIEPGYHNADPLHPNQGFLASDWDKVKPFAIECASDFRAANIVGTAVADRLKFLNSSLYLQNYRELKAIGSRTSTVRTAEQTEIANFWAYDGGPKIGQVQRLLNQIVQVIAVKKKNALVQNARLFRMINYAVADSAIVSLETKYYYNFWRPILAIRTGTALTSPAPNWMPLGSPADGNGDNFTPATPSYSSGHVIVSTSAFQVLRRFYGTDSMRYTLRSDEYNGETVDSTTGEVRPVKTRRYKSFTQAENEVINSRVYLGIHWRFDGNQARKQGHQVANYVFNALN